MPNLQSTKHWLESRKNYNKIIISSSNIYIKRMLSFKLCFWNSNFYHRYWAGKVMLQRGSISWTSCGELYNVKHRLYSIWYKPKLLHKEDIQNHSNNRMKTIKLMIFMICVLILSIFIILSIMIWISLIIWNTKLNDYLKMLYSIFLIILCIFVLIIYKTISCSFIMSF